VNLTRSYYQGALGALVVFDVTNPKVAYDTSYLFS
jgi:hypothetical protein